MDTDRETYFTIAALAIGWITLIILNIITWKEANTKSNKTDAYLLTVVSLIPPVAYGVGILTFVIGCVYIITLPTKLFKDE